MRLKSALRRGVAAAVIAGIVVSSGIPAYAERWNIAKGDITVEAGGAGGTNKVTQGETTKEDTDTVITGESDKSTVTIDTSKGNVDVTFDDLKIDVSKEGEAAVRVEGNGDVTIELDGDNELKSGGKNAGLEKNGNESSGKLTIKDDNDTKGSLTAEGGAGGGAGIGGKHESGAGNIEITGGTIKAEGGEGAAGIGGGVYGIGHDIEISGGKVSATGGNANKNLESSRPGAAGIGDGAGTGGTGAGTGGEIVPDAPSNPNHIYISGDAEVEAKAGASTGGKTAAIGGDVGEIPNSALSDDHHKVTGGSLTRYDPAGKKMEDYSYDRRTPSQWEQPDDSENDDEDDTPNSQSGEVPDHVKQMYEAIGVITHLDGTQELGDVTTAEYDPVNRVLSFDAHGSVFRMTGDSLRELAKEVHELRIRFLDGNGQEMEAVIPLARIKDLVGVNGAFELELSQEGLYRFYVVGQTGYDRKTFSDETALRRNGRELVLVYRVGDEEQKAQETARVEEAIARRKQEKKQWGTVLSGRESSSLSGLPELTQPGTSTVGGVTGSIADPKVTDMGSITVRLPGKSASDSTGWKTFTGNIVKFVSGKQDSKKDDPAPSVGDLSGLPTLSPDSLTTAQQPETIGKQPETIGKQPETIGKQPETIGKQPETIGKQPETIGKQPETIGKQPEAIAQQPETGTQQPETSAQQPEVRGWVKDSQGKWVWRSGQESAQQPDWKPNKWVTLHDYGPWDPFYDSAYWETRKWVRVSQPPDLAWWDPSYDSAWMYDYEG